MYIIIVSGIPFNLSFFPTLLDHRYIISIRTSASAANYEVLSSLALTGVAAADPPEVRLSVFCGVRRCGCQSLRILSTIPTTQPALAQYL